MFLQGRVHFASPNQAIYFYRDYPRLKAIGDTDRCPKFGTPGFPDEPAPSLEERLQLSSEFDYKMMHKALAECDSSEL